MAQGSTTCEILRTWFGTLENSDLTVVLFGCIATFVPIGGSTPRVFLASAESLHFYIHVVSVMSDKYEVCIHVCVLSVYISKLLICMFFHVNIEHLCIQKAWLLNSLCVQETSLNTPSLSTSYYSSSFSLDSSSLPSISSHLVAKRTVFLPKEPQFIANAKTSEHTHQDESNQVGRKHHKLCNPGVAPSI